MRRLLVQCVCASPQAAGSATAVFWYPVAMPINEWSDDIVIAEVSDEPQFSDDLTTLTRSIEQRPPDRTPSVIVDLKDVSFVNSSNIAQLLRLRQLLLNRHERLKICAARDPVWSVLLITGLDKVFEFNDNIATALASLQIEA